MVRVLLLGALVFSGANLPRAYEKSVQRPDLVVSSAITVTPSTVAAGSPVTFSGWTVRNQGAAGSGVFSNGFNLSANPVLTPADDYLGGNSNTGLATGQSFTWEAVSLTVPAGTAPGVYYLGALVDRGNAVTESNEANNARSAQVIVAAAPKPDLAIPPGLTAANTAVTSGGTVMPSGWTVSNQGNAASDGFANGFYLSTDPVITAGDVYLGGNWNSGLAAGESFHCGGPALTIPQDTAPGACFVGALADRTEAMSESDEGNNYRSTPVLVVSSAAPDLVITSTLRATPASVAPGGTVNLSGWTVKSQGNAASGRFSNGYYLSADPEITSSDTFLEGNSNAELAPEQTTLWAGTALTIPAGAPPGTYYIGILAGRASAVAETDESNNYQSVEITVTSQGQDPPVPVGRAVVKAASYDPSGVSPGMIVVIYGTNMGPANLAGLQLTADRTAVTAVLGRTRIYFDGVAAPLIYVSAHQSAAVVPYRVSGRASTEIVVENDGRRSVPMRLPVVASMPGIFSLNRSGGGPGAILNADYRVNGPGNPAARGGVVMVYATGEGLVNPGLPDGTVVAGTLPRPRLPVTATVGGIAARVESAGGAPGLVAGVMQVNVTIPANAPTGSAIPIVITAATAKSHHGVDPLGGCLTPTSRLSGDRASAAGSSPSSGRPRPSSLGPAG